MQIRSRYKYLCWSEYIDGIVNNFEIGLEKTFQIYTIFNILEYVSIVWNGCSTHDPESLEKVQLCATRIASSLVI